MWFAPSAYETACPQKRQPSLSFGGHASMQPPSHRPTITFAQAMKGYNAWKSKGKSGSHQGTSRVSHGMRDGAPDVCLASVADKMKATFDQYNAMKSDVSKPFHLGGHRGPKVNLHKDSKPRILSNPPRFKAYIAAEWMNESRNY